MSFLLFVLMVAAPPASVAERKKPRTPPGQGAQPTDGFGVAMLYPTKPGGEEWALARELLEDPRFDPGASLSRNPDGSWKVTAGQVRLEVYTSTGYDPAAISTYDRQALEAAGYMQAPNDWRNVEMTGYVRLNAASTLEENFSWYARGGRHADDIACEGSSYKGALHYDGSARWLKESWHVSYDSSPRERATSALQGRWVGLKAVMRNVTVEGRRAVQLELWVDEDADGLAWKKVSSLTDDGQWGGASSACGGLVDAMPMTWGGPIVAFRWDGATDVDFKWLSVREIE